MRRAFARESGGSSRPRPFREGSETLFHKALARAFDRHATGRDLLDDFLIGEPFSGLHQNAGAHHLSGCSLARADEA